MSTYEDAPGAADADNTEADGARGAPDLPEDDELDPTKPPDGTNVGA